MQKAEEYKNKFGVDGIMIGRAAIGYPWIFNEIKHYFETGEMLEEPTVAERVRITKKHFEFSLKWKGDRKGVFEMRRHYTNYFRGLPHFKPFRTRLVELDNPQEIFATLDEIQNHYQEIPRL